MSSLDRGVLWSRLAEAGLVAGEVPPALAGRTPWPVRVMLGVAGWFGGLLLLAFAGAVFAVLFRNEAVALPVGVLCCAGAYAAFRLGAGSDLFEQSGFAVSVAGQILITFGLGKWLHSDASILMYLLMAMVEGVLALALPNFIHRVFTTVAANVFVFLAASAAGAPALAIGVAAAGAAMVWLDSEWIAMAPNVWRPLGYGFVIALVHMDGSLLIGPEPWRMVLPTAAPLMAMWVGPVAVGLVLCWTAWRIANRWESVALALPVAVFGLAAPGVSAAVLVLVLGFANGNRVLLGLGMLAFGSYLSYFYYQLSLTLLVKAGALVGAGLGLLALRFLLAWLWPVKAGDHA